MCPSDKVHLQLSYSKVSTFIECRRKFFLRYIEDLVPKETGPAPLREGTLLHIGLAALAKTKNIQAAFEVMKQEAEATESNDTALMLARCKSALWQYFASSLYTAINVRETEVRIEEPLTRRGKVTLTGYVDGIGSVLIGAEATPVPVVVEYKRVQMLAPIQEAQLGLDYQPDFYLHSQVAERNRGTYARIVLYVFIQMPAIKLALATPEADRKYTKSGALYASCRDKDETIEEYTNRLAEWYVAHPDAIRSVMVTRSVERGKQFVELMKQVSTDMAKAVKCGSFYRNPAACRYRSCPYASICVDDCPEVREMCFTQGKGEGNTKGVVTDEGTECAEF